MPLKLVFQASILYRIFLSVGPSVSRWWIEIWASATKYTFGGLIVYKYATSNLEKKHFSTVNIPTKLRCSHTQLTTWHYITSQPLALLFHFSFGPISFRAMGDNQNADGLCRCQQYSCPNWGHRGLYVYGLIYRTPPKQQVWDGPRDSQSPAWTLRLPLRPLRCFGCRATDRLVSSSKSNC